MIKMKKKNIIKKRKIALAVVCMLLVMFMTIPVRAFAADNDDVPLQTTGTAVTGISIDGYYDDWEDKPMSMLTWNSNNGTAHHDVSLLKDEEYIYIYLRMHPSYQSPIPIYAINLSINGQTCQMFLGHMNSQNTTDWGRYVDLSHNGRYTDLHPFTYYPNNSLGNAAVTVSKGSINDRFEIRVSIKDLEKVMGLKAGTINSGSQIKLNMPNVGGGTVELMGTSTGTVIGILLCVGVVVGVRLYRRKKVVTVK